MTIGPLLRRLRIAQNLTLEQVESLCEIGAGNLSRIERDKQGISVETLQRIAKALNVPLSGIFREIEGGDNTTGVSDLDYALIPRLDLHVAAGNGYQPEAVSVVDSLAFRRDWLRQRGLKPEQLEIYMARGESMAPAIANGDIVLVEVGERQPQSGEAWVIWQPQPAGIRVKRLLFRENGDLVIRSDNPDKALYPDELITGPRIAEEVRLVGRVVWRGG